MQIKRARQSKKQQRTCQLLFTTCFFNERGFANYAHPPRARRPIMEMRPSRVIIFSFTKKRFSIFFFKSPCQSEAVCLASSNFNASASLSQRRWSDWREPSYHHSHHHWWQPKTAIEGPLHRCSSRKVRGHRDYGELLLLQLLPLPHCCLLLGGTAWRGWR